ncbi:glutamate synthase large subunit [Roseibacillus ishigakijimensis]|uniref:Glutamate synthase [NADPH] large chain n=1 Tax=Roseibacillus ishigakijimensis TaxID=454146 RepID=A0A934RNY2_9BACT|nr:glutamate synthase large subunit [Roseibacillus ishigakijimensis]MBK1835282.1 glutamate synthase large subunit [Roseibacillus ishigakijimensis]
MTSLSPYHPAFTPDTSGTLHSFANEKDNCGMGAIAHLDGLKSYEIIERAIDSVCCMTHRGAIDADGKTGDGSGVLTQIPRTLFSRELSKMSQSIRDINDLAVGVFFLPADDAAAAQSIQEKAVSLAGARGIKVLGWREVPVNPDELGNLAAKSQPNIQHLLLERPREWACDHFERQLYLVRRLLEREFAEVPNFYIPTLSSRLISYKGLAMPATLRAFYSDLQDSDFQVALALYHQRFSTNTFPAWPLGQPFRMMCHNGEINTVRGNRNWWASREEFFENDVWGDEIELLKGVMSGKESDSASLDHALEILVLSGRSLEHAMCMLVPPAFRHDQEISEEVRDFFHYHRSFAEPWDGPAGLVFTDGEKVCASLDRNGLRPSRFTLSNEGLLIIGSESGTSPIEESKVARRGRLGPGQMISANTETGELLFDREIKNKLAAQQNYGKWVDENRVELRKYVSHEPHSPTCEFDAIELSQLQVTHGVTAEDLDMVFPPMVKGAQEAVFSMGDDIPLAPLSRYPRLLFTYFKQLFAQVTNPPIDPIREWAVMTLAAGLGRERNMLEETPEHGRILHLESAILFEQEVEYIAERSAHGFKSAVLDTTFPVENGPFGLRTAVEALCRAAEKAVDDGAEIIILSDKKVCKERAPIPSLMVTGAVHHHLTKTRKRLRTSLVIETGEARDTHQLACLFGYGATAVCPYLGYATARAVLKDPQLIKKHKFTEDLTPEIAMANYRKALEKGLLKIMSKMGISVLNSYQGAQIFEALGVGAEVVDFCFTGTVTRIGGVGFNEIAQETLTRHRTAYAEEATAPLDLGDPGYNRYRKAGESHAISTEVISNLHTFVKHNKMEDYEDYVKASLANNPITIKDLLEFRTEDATPVPLEEVEPAENIVKRFTTAAMSLGALSPEAHETLAIAMNRLGGKSDSGEGGEDVRRFKPYPNGENARSAIKQVASGRFGVSAHYLVNCDEIEIKMAQGAKPGEGGQLPGHKVNGLIARLRNTQPGVQLISPPPHHDIYSIEDLAQLIHDLKEVNPKARVTVKLVAEAGVGTVAAGVAKACADNILVSGHDGGTAASPLSSTKHCGLPWELGVAEAQQTLVLNNLRDRVVLRTDGGFRNGRDVVIGAMLGAEEFNFGTIAMIAMGCVYVRKCHLNNCPVGVATTDPKWRAKFKGTPEHVVNFMMGVAGEARQHMASLGIRTIEEMIGHTRYLRQREVPNHPKAATLDLSKVLREATPNEGFARFRTHERNMGIHKPALDLQILEDLRAHVGGAEGDNPAELLMDSAPFAQTYPVVNTDRNIGTRLSGRIAEVFGNKGLPADSIKLTFTGSAGQSFGTFLAGGITLTLAGEGNDYVGKGMAGGTIVVHPPEDINPGFVAAENSIVGNTVLYGATGGELYANGRAGERFCVRNSGATAVCEGVGDHGCEYMTNGLVVILGLTGKNFGAGMSGGVAYVLDEDGQFQSRLNSEMVVALPVAREQDIAEVKSLIESHLQKTGSVRAKELLANWESSLLRLLRVIPKDRHTLELEEAKHESAVEPVS